MKKRLLCFVLCVVFMMSLIPVQSSAVTKIHSVAITNLDYPQNGVSLDTEVSLVGSGYSVHSIEWHDKTADYFLSPGEVPTEGHEYDVVIWLEVDSGYEFNYANTYTPNVSATVNGLSAKVSKAYEYYPWAMIEVCFSFPAVPGHTWVHSIDLWPTTPEIGKEPQYDMYSRNDFKLVTLSGTEGYTKYGQSWMSGAGYLTTTGNKFLANETYTFCATVTPAYGYSFSLDPIVTVRGNTASYTTEYVSGVGEVMYVRYTFPKLEAPHEHSSSTWIGSTDYHYKICSSCGEAYNYEDHTGGTATCSEQAKCTLCGESYGSLSEHTPSDWRSVEPYHYKVCSVCGEFLTQENHSGGTATCSEQAKCTVCGGSYGALKEHTPSAWRSVDPYHYKVCTVCGEFLTQEDHSGGTATCSEKGKCTVCGHAYLAENEVHDPDTSTWTACGNLYHAHLCKDCGAHAITEDHKPGPAATETEPQKCTVCGYVIAPVLNHTHKLTKVAKKDATCTEGGNVEYYTCSGCSELFADSKGKTAISESDIAIPPKGDKTSESIESDGEFHWRTCSECKTVLTETKLLHEDSNKDGKCDTCNDPVKTGTTAVTTEVSAEASTTTLPATGETTASPLPPEESTVSPSETADPLSPVETTASPVPEETHAVGTSSPPVTSSPVATGSPESTPDNASTSSPDGKEEGNNKGDGNTGKEPFASRLEKKILIALAIAIPSVVVVSAGIAAPILIISLKKKK